MNEYPFKLEPYKGMATRYRCPSCQHRDKTFVRYINTETGEHIHPDVGKCNRLNKCGFHYPPKQYFHDNNISFDTTQPKQYYKQKTVTPQPKPVSFIPVEVFKQSLQIEESVTKIAETNHFVKFLFDLFGEEITNELIKKYFIGTSKHQFKSKDFPNYISEQGATVFWQKDIHGNIRTGQIILYSHYTGKRVTEPFNHISWVHSVLKLPEFSLQQRLFGEHLLIDKTKPVAIVESVKTAIIASVYLPQLIWLATGGLEGLNAEKCSILKGRNVFLFPDLSKPDAEINCFDEWSDKANELSLLFPGTPFIVSDLLEREATEAERQQGLDLADFLIRNDHRDFQKAEQPEPPKQISDPPQTIERVQVQELKPIEQKNYSHKPEISKADNWEQEITELEHCFGIISLPQQAVKLNQCTTISNVPFFIQSHLAVVKANNGKRTFLPYLERLRELKRILIL